MKQYAWLILGVIVFAIMGCSKGDRKNNGGGEGQNAATPAASDITLTAGEGDEMTFTVRVGGEVKVTLTGNVRSDMMRTDALTNEDGTQFADVMSVSGKNHIFVVLHDEETAPDSTLYLFTLTDGVYSLRISGVLITSTGALNKILSALETHVDTGMDLDAAVTHMVDAFNGDSRLTFEAYLESLAPERTGGPVILDPEDGDQRRDNDEERFDWMPDEEHRHPDYRSEPTPVDMGDRIKPRISERPVPRPTYRPPQTNGSGGSGVISEPPGGRNVIVRCFPSESVMTVEGQPRARVNALGCFDRNHKSDKFRASVVLDRFMTSVDSMNGLKLRIDIDLSKVQFITKAKFRGRPVIWPNNGADIRKGTSEVVYYGPNVGVFASSYVMDSPFRDTMEMNLTCKVQRTYRACGH